MRDVSIDRIMTTNPITTGPYVPVVEARAKLQSNDLHHLPVVDGDKLVGILSASDLFKFSLLEEDAKVLEDIQVRMIMQAKPHVLLVGSNLRSAADRLSNGGFHALPVVEDDQTLVGIVTSSDLIRHLLQQIPVGDGSLQTTGITNHGAASWDIDESAAINEAEQDAASKGERIELEKTLVNLYNRNQKLDAVYQAAERYMRSGLAEHEHTVLVKCLSEIRAPSTNVNL